jgi:hypothetical protein
MVLKEHQVDYIYVQIFLDTRRLANCLSENLQIKVTTPKAPGKNGTLRIYVTVSSMDRLRSLILDHMHPSMLYKLGLYFICVVNFINKV